MQPPFLETGLTSGMFRGFRNGELDTGQSYLLEQFLPGGRRQIMFQHRSSVRERRGSVQAPTRERWRSPQAVRRCPDSPSSCAGTSKPSIFGMLRSIRINAGFVGSQLQSVLLGSLYDGTS